MKDHQSLFSPFFSDTFLSVAHVLRLGNSITLDQEIYAHVIQNHVVSTDGSEPPEGVRHHQGM